MVDGVNLRHDVIDLPSLQLAFIVPKNELTSSVDLIHNTAVLPIELQEDNPVLLVQTSLIASKYLLFLIILYLQLMSFF